MPEARLRLPDYSNGRRLIWLSGFLGGIGCSLMAFSVSGLVYLRMLL